MELPGVVAHDEQGEYGPFNGGMGPYPEQQGRLGGGGWAEDPMGLSGKDGKGLWMPPIGTDGEKNVEALPVERADFGSERVWPNSLLPTVMGWDERYMESRRETDTY